MQLSSQNFGISGILVVLLCSSLLTGREIRSWEKEACSPAKLQGQTRYTCKGGKIICKEGWIGDLCQVPVCGKDCSPVHGYCTKPGECTCNLGYSGTDCSVCMTLPGCKHGYCTKSFECKCEEGWSGSFCNVAECPDSCKHGSCAKPNVCSCNSGYGGANCTECATPKGCLHGTCTSPGECKCNAGWSGPLCNVPICAEGCQGICSKPGECRCDVGWEGKNCDVCVPYPGCANGGCRRPWECNCQEGWTGRLCDRPGWSTGWRGGVCTPIGSFLCMNGGTEICNYWGNGSLVEPPKCLCTEGFTGTWCDEKMTNLPRNTSDNQKVTAEGSTIVIGSQEIKKEEDVESRNVKKEMSSESSIKESIEGNIAVKVQDKLENPLQWSNSNNRYIGSGRRTS